MTKEVLLSLQGLQYSEEEGSQAIETITPAEYYYRNDNHYVLYDEVMESYQETTKNIFKFRDNSLEVTKKGIINVQMIFESKKKNITNYMTPYGELVIGIDTDSVILTREEEKIFVEVQYALDINYAFVADCNIRLEVRSKENGGFLLQGR